MRVASDDTLFTNKNSTTLDEQIKFCSTKNVSQDFFTNEKTTPDKKPDELAIVFQKVEKEISKVDKKILYESFSRYTKTPEDIKKADINSMTPVEAMNLLFELNNRLK